MKPDVVEQIVKCVAGSKNKPEFSSRTWSGCSRNSSILARSLTRSLGKARPEPPLLTNGSSLLTCTVIPYTLKPHME